MLVFTRQVKSAMKMLLSGILGNVGSMFLEPERDQVLQERISLPLLSLLFSNVSCKPPNFV